MWSNLELSSTLFELGRARMAGGLAVEVGIWSHGSWEDIRTLDHRLNQLDPLIGQGAKSRFQSVATLQRDLVGQGSEVSIRAVFPRVYYVSTTSVVNRPGRKVGTAH